MIRARLAGLLSGLLAALLFANVALAIDITVLPDPKLQVRYEALTHEFRCMQCQNNTIADSPVGLASDLRRDVAEMLVAGKSDDEIRAYMVQRYGNVILFTPPFKGSAIWVWLTPLVALLGGIAVAFVIVRRRGRLVASDESDVDQAIR
jgi:cytochrome c-type biogenesis protein CcmH